MIYQYTGHLIIQLHTLYLKSSSITEYSMTGIRVSNADYKSRRVYIASEFTFQSVQFFGRHLFVKWKLSYWQL